MGNASSAIRHLLSASRLPGAVSCAIGFALLVLAGTSFAQRANPPDPDDVARRIAALTNEFREQEGRGKVAANEQLTAAARYFAEYLGQAEQFSHEADGSTTMARAERHGYHSSCVWENIATRYSSATPKPDELAQAFVDGWKKSPRHRQNMLEAGATEAGMAVAPGKDGHYYAVQMFGLPASQVIEFSIINRTESRMGYRLGDKTFPLDPMQTRTHKQCRTEELTFDFPRQARSAAFRPKPGNRFAVVRLESGEFRVVAREK